LKQPQTTTPATGCVSTGWRCTHTPTVYTQPAASILKPLTNLPRSAHSTTSHLQAGFGNFQVSQWKGKRKDAYATHLKDALGRPNLSVVTGARATQLATESGSSGTRAVGVEYAVGGPAGTRQTGVQGGRCADSCAFSFVLAGPLASCCECAVARSSYESGTEVTVVLEQCPPSGVTSLLPFWTPVMHA
jgi:choline dehydrogenase-like flavoprotein